MKKLLVALNAKYIHTNLALHTINQTLKKQGQSCEMLELTINHSFDQMVKEIYLKKPDLIAFSCYIWNIELVSAIIKTLKKILPQTIIVVGGPEVAYQVERIFERMLDVDVVVTGEGELILPKLFLALEGQNKFSQMSGELDLGCLESVEGVAYKYNGNVKENPLTTYLPMDEIPFPYEDLSQYDHRIIYYESSRGCPFKCAYCLSSLEKSVRYKSLDMTTNDLDRFLAHGVKQVKFIDRTFNMDIKRAFKLWEYLILHDNGKTNFHFEVSGDLFDESSLILLKKARPGLFQFEMGIQSTFEPTTQAINRRNDWPKILWAVGEILSGKNIHLHVDLIAGLPLESYAQFQKSFNDTYQLGAEQLQLGFLKVLKGSIMEQMAPEYGIKYKEMAPYEVLMTNELTYDELLDLKNIESVLETYGNSGHFQYSLPFGLNQYENPFAFFEAFAKWMESKGYFSVAHQISRYFDLYFHFITEGLNDEQREMFREMLKLDWILLEKPRRYPEVLSEQIAYKDAKIAFYRDESRISTYCPQYNGVQSKQISRMTHIEVFTYPFLDKSQSGCWGALIDYQIKNPLTNRPEVILIPIDLDMESGQEG